MLACMFIVLCGVTCISVHVCCIGVHVSCPSVHILYSGKFLQNKIFVIQNFHRHGSKNENSRIKSLQMLATVT